MLGSLEMWMHRAQPIISRISALSVDPDRDLDAYKRVLHVLHYLVVGQRHGGSDIGARRLGTGKRPS